MLWLLQSISSAENVFDSSQTGSLCRSGTRPAPELPLPGMGQGISPKLLQRLWWPRFILVILVSAHWKCFLAFRHAAGQSFPKGCEPQTCSVVIAELFCYSAMQKQQAFRLINKSSTHLWCEKWNIYACQSNVSVLQPHALLMPDGGWSKYQLV